MILLFAGNADKKKHRNSTLYKLAYMGVGSNSGIILQCLNLASFCR